MRYLVISAMLLFVLGCSQKDTDVVLVERFWAAAKNNNVEEIKTLISKPENASIFGKDNGVSIDVDIIKVGRKLDNGNVEFTYKRFCYLEMSSETKLVQIDGESKVDVHATFRAHLKDSKGVEPLKKYCYPFEDQAMSGKISGADVTLKYLNKSVVDFGTHKDESYELSAEPCPNGNCFNLKTPRILVSKLDFNDSGGNFNNNENITLFTPPHYNELITEGSYRVTETATGKNKLEISFKSDDSNYINGFIEY